MFAPSWFQRWRLWVGIETPILIADDSSEEPAAKRGVAMSNTINKTYILFFIYDSF
jgi:hypothetical protein